MRADLLGVLDLPQDSLSLQCTRRIRDSTNSLRPKKKDPPATAG